MVGVGGGNISIITLNQIKAHEHTVQEFLKSVRVSVTRVTRLFLILPFFIWLYQVLVVACRILFASCRVFTVAHGPSSCGAWAPECAGFNNRST